MATLLNDRYELGDVLGSGGMGQVFRATDTRLARPVAVKILRGADGTDQDVNARARFRSEAQLAGSLHHPGIAQIYDVGEDESTPEHDPFIVMQLIEGTPLSQVLRERRTLPADEVASIIGQVADALDAAHSAGIVHRDLKPSNIIITATGKAVLVDFGIAWSATSEPLTATGSIIGTAEYFSPEQATGRPATARSDLYSLGVVAHHCLAGESPFRRDTPVATAMAQLHDPLPALSDAVPATLRTLITALTQKNPDDRPSSAALVASLATAEHPATAVLTPPLTDASTTGSIAAPSAMDPSTGPAHIVVDPEPPRRPVGRYVALVAAAVVLVLAAILGVTALGGDSDDTPTTSTGTPTPTPTPSDGGDSSGGGSGGSNPGTSKPPVSTTTVDADALIGLTFDDAAAMLSDLGLDVVRADRISSDPSGTVTAVNPAGEVPDGSTITLTVATEAPTESPTTPTPDPTADTPGGPGEPKGEKDPGKKKP